MPNIAPLPKTVYNNSNGEPKDEQTADTRYEAWDAEQISGKTNEIITELNSKVNSTNTGEPTGSDVVLNVVSLTQAEYDLGTPIATTFYLITDA